MYKIRLQRFFFWNLQQMGKVTRLFCWHQDFVHKGLSAPVPGLYTCGKTLKNVYKIWGRFVWNLQQMVKVIRAFCWHQKFVPKGFSALARGLYTCIKSLKMCIKSDFKRDHFETCNIWAKRKGLSVVIKLILSPMDCLSLPGAIYIWWNRKKMYIKLDFKAIFFLNLQQMGKVIRAFCWHQKFVPEGLSALAPGLYTYIKSFKVCIKSDFIF